MNIATVRAALATALDAGVTGVQINPYAVASPTPPGLQVLPPGVEYDRAMRRGIDEWTWIIQGFVPFTSDIGSQKLLDALCNPSGSGSVKAALEADVTLAGAVQSIHVLSQSPGKLVERPDGNPMLLVEWQIQILATG